MSDFDDLDDLLGPLRSAATPAELASEQDVVALMAANHASKGTTMFTSRRARVATLIAAGIIGFGGVAAAGPAASILREDKPVEEERFEEPAVEPAVEEPAIEEEGEGDGEEMPPEGEEVVEEMPSPAAVEESTELVEVLPEELTDFDDPDTHFDENLCVGEGNHGHWVSMAARGDLKIEDFTQRDIAQSSCGKMDDDTEAEEETDAEVEEEVEDEDAPEVVEEPEVDDEETEQPAAPSRGKSDQAPGKSGGRSNNGNGKKGG